MPQITFRIADNVAQQLDNALLGSTRAEFARNALMAAMDGQSLAEVNRGLTALHSLLEQQSETQRKANLAIEQNMETFVQEIEDLRGDLATTVVGILTRIGTAVSQDEAEKFVRRTLLGETQEEVD